MPEPAAATSSSSPYASNHHTEDAQQQRHRRQDFSHGDDGVPPLQSYVSPILSDEMHQILAPSMDDDGGNASSPRRSQLLDRDDQDYLELRRDTTDIFASIDDNFSGLGSEYSSADDSIIRRVEAEIAAARRAAASAKGTIYQPDPREDEGEGYPTTTSSQAHFTPSSRFDNNISPCSTIKGMSTDEDMFAILNTVSHEEKKTIDPLDETPYHNTGMRASSSFANKPDLVQSRSVRPLERPMIASSFNKNTVSSPSHNNSPHHGLFHTASGPTLVNQTGTAMNSGAGKEDVRKAVSRTTVKGSEAAETSSNPIAIKEKNEMDQCFHTKRKVEHGSQHETLADDDDDGFYSASQDQDEYSLEPNLDEIQGKVTTTVAEANKDSRLDDNKEEKQREDHGEELGGQISWTELSEKNSPEVEVVALLPEATNDSAQPVDVDLPLMAKTGADDGKSDSEGDCGTTNYQSPPADHFLLEMEASSDPTSNDSAAAPEYMVASGSVHNVEHIGSAASQLRLENEYGVVDVSYDDERDIEVVLQLSEESLLVSHHAMAERTALRPVNDDELSAQWAASEPEMNLPAPMSEPPKVDVHESGRSPEVEDHYQVEAKTISIEASHVSNDGVSHSEKPVTEPSSAVSPLPENPVRVGVGEVRQHPMTPTTCPAVEPKTSSRTHLQEGSEAATAAPLVSHEEKFPALNVGELPGNPQEDIRSIEKITSRESTSVPILAWDGELAEQITMPPVERESDLLSDSAWTDLKTPVVSHKSSIFGKAKDSQGPSSPDKISNLPKTCEAPGDGVSPPIYVTEKDVEDAIPPLRDEAALMETIPPSDSLNRDGRVLRRSLDDLDLSLGSANKAIHGEDLKTVDQASAVSDGTVVVRHAAQLIRAIDPQKFNNTEAQRAREILDTLKERRECYTTSLIASGRVTAPSEASASTPESSSNFRSTATKLALSRGRLIAAAAVASPESPRNPAVESNRLKFTRRGLNHSIESSSPKAPGQASSVDELSRRPQKRIVDIEEDLAIKSRRIRFRDPFPVLKPPVPPRYNEEIIADYSIGTPDVPIRWIKPRQELKQLIVAAMGTSLARRSNACGALKVLTTEKKNQLTLVRTDSFLTAIIFAATQPIPAKEKDLGLDARTRAVSCIRNVCGPIDNRVPVLKHPGVTECLVKVVREDRAEARALAAGALAMLAKTPGCREALIEVDGLLEVLGLIMQGVEVFPNQTVPSETQTSIDKQAMSSITEPEGSGSVNGGDDDINEAEETEEDDEDEGTESSASIISDGSEKVELRPEELRRVDSIRHRQQERRSEFSQQSRANACAVLLHLSKQCAVSHNLCCRPDLLSNLVAVTHEKHNPIHSKCLHIICNLSRFPSNNKILTRHEGLIPTLLAAANNAPLVEDRIQALRTFQNMSGDSSSKEKLATAAVLNLLTAAAVRKDPDEKEAAVATLYNITTEPGAVVAITNTRNVVATLVHLAHNPESTSEVRIMACEALATISLWLQTLAGTGRVPDGVNNVPLPTQSTTGWERWD